MHEDKYDFKCIYFTNKIIQKLGADGYFLQSLIEPETLRYIILKLVQNNFDAVGKMDLSRAQMEGALDKAFEISHKENIEAMIKDGWLEYDGIDDDGEYMVHLTSLGKKSYEESAPMRKKIRKAIEEEQNKKNNQKGE